MIGGMNLKAAAVTWARRMRRVLFGVGEVDIGIERYWSDEHHRAVRGCMVSRTAPIEKIEVRAGNKWLPAECAPRADLGHGVAFAAQFAHQEPMRIDFRVLRNGRWSRHRMVMPPPDAAEKLPVPDGSPLFDRFIREVNDRRLRVLEIGSRIVSPGSVSKRPLFPNAASFTGFDYYKDDNTDIAGDAHRLSELVGDQKFDAVFSIAVFEHLAMPWVVAREINRILAPGGITYHGTVFSWPTHERPWDFWRLSDEGLKVLFAPALGYEVLGAGMFDPVSMHFRELRAGHEGFPHAAAFASSAILARKVSDTDPDAFRWPASLADFVGQDSHYPEGKTS